MCVIIYIQRGDAYIVSYRIGMMRRKHRDLSTIIYEGIDVFDEAIMLLEFMASDAQPLEMRKKIAMDMEFLRNFWRSLLLFLQSY